MGFQMDSLLHCERYNKQRQKQANSPPVDTDFVSSVIYFDGDVAVSFLGKFDWPVSTKERVSKSLSYGTNLSTDEQQHLR